MIINIKEFIKFINKNTYYILHLYGFLINRQKVVVIIQVFFDILVLEGEVLELFKIKINNILSNVIKDFKRSKIDHIKTFLFYDYYIEKKLYLCIYTINTKQRKLAMKAI